MPTQSTLTESKLSLSNQATEGNKLRLLLALMAPSVMMVLNFSMFSVALPTIRDTFGIQADTTAWLLTIYTLPFMIFSPLYGRFGDGLGKQRVLLFGVVIFLLGTAITLLATNLSFLMVGRVIQGFGSAGFIPLSIAIISHHFPTNERGKALGTWNSVAPITSMIGPLLGGLLVARVNWRLVFGPVLIVGLVVLWVIPKYVPAKQNKVQIDFLTTFDWGGVALLAMTVTALTFYLSSQSITGIIAFQDWRLLSLTLLLGGGMYFWEKRHSNPFVALHLFAYKTFSQASLCAATRMFAMGGIGFLMPLYLTDIHRLDAVSMGGMLTLHAGALLVTLRLGGQLADRWFSRWPVTVGLGVQGAAMVCLALWSDTTALWMIGSTIIGHGLGAGLSLAALHRVSMAQIPHEQTGTAAGLYSLIRFGGTVTGPALAGVVLQQGLNQLGMPIAAYQIIFWLIAGVAGLGVVLAWNLRE